MIAVLVLGLPLSSCAQASDHAGSEAEAGTAPSERAEIAEFPANPIPDYQLGESYDPDPAVELVVRDRGADPDPARFSVCYVNAFQTQPGELDDWPEELVLSDDGKPVMDPAWPDEALLDTSTEALRDGIVERVAPWIEGCADRGFQAVEFDNLDTFTRSDGALAMENNLALAEALVAVAHESGLAAGQKNSSEYTSELRGRAGFDFAVAEECAVFEECGAYTDVYGDRFIDIEYSDELPRSFAELCGENGSPSWMILRDRRLTAPGSAEYVFERCPAAE